MFTEAGVVNKNGFYSTFERYASDLEKAIDQAEDSDDYEAEMDGYIQKTTDAGVVYKDASGRERSLAAGIKSTVRRAEQQLNIVLAAEIGESMGADGMYISWHADYRPTHDFGGVAYTMAEYERDILPKLLEPNCRHRAYPVILDEFDYVNIPEYLNKLMAENNEKLGIGNGTKNSAEMSGDETDKNNSPYLSMPGLENIYASNMPGYRNINDVKNTFPSITQAIKETNDKLAKIDEEIRKAKARETYLRSIRFTKEADKELAKIRELESEKKALTNQKEVMREAEQKKWYDYLWDSGAKIAYESGKVIVSFANGLAGGAVKALTFGLVDPKLDALIKDPNTIAYKAGNIVGEFGAGIAAFFINPISGAGAAVTTAGEVVQVTAAAAKAIIAGSAAKAAVSDVIQFASDSSSNRSSSSGDKKNNEKDYSGKSYDGSRNPDADFTNSKGNSTLKDHYNRHGSDFKSADDYLNNARNFLEKEPTSTTQSFVSNEGWYFRYDTATNEFGIMNQYGGVSTYYNPPDGIDYWLDQIVKYAPK